ncbi:MAG TPA: ribokinase [Lentisphaeria bacterium]|nr:MAG: ribokinase [Lentisphaerae bacterium GWF2_49_21]HBC85784.1 ribokinase [Lentisphaeria bacterium]
MKILNFGSVNIDHVYSVEHFVRPGETLSSLLYSRFSGGKGANQSIALAKAGADVFHAGKIGSDGIWLKDNLKKCGVCTGFLKVGKIPTGHAVIQVSKSGENSIVLYGGSNQDIDENFAKKAIAKFSKGDYLLLQNEISSIPFIMEKAHQRGMKIVFNPAPMNSPVKSYPLKLVDIFILNEIEGSELSGRKGFQDVLREMKRKYPKALTIMTLGSKGAAFIENGRIVFVPAVKVKPVDTTAAGDTFIGYFLAGIAKGMKTGDAARMACRASAICVTRKGAADSIPEMREVRRTALRA